MFGRGLGFLHHASMVQPAMPRCGSPSLTITLEGYGEMVPQACPLSGTTESENISVQLLAWSCPRNAGIPHSPIPQCRYPAMPISRYPYALPPARSYSLRDRVKPWQHPGIAAMPLPRNATWPQCRYPARPQGRNASRSQCHMAGDRMAAMPAAPSADGASMVQRWRRVSAMRITGNDRQCEVKAMRGKGNAT